MLLKILATVSEKHRNVLKDIWNNMLWLHIIWIFFFYDIGKPKKKSFIKFVGALIDLLTKSSQKNMTLNMFFISPNFKSILKSTVYLDIRENIKIWSDLILLAIWSRFKKWIFFFHRNQNGKIREHCILPCHSPH